MFFRLYHLDHKVVWTDEIFSELRVVGLTERDVVAKSGTFENVRTLRAYLARGSRTDANGSQATIRSLIEEDPQHPPLYYLLERGWVWVVGDEVRMQRLLPALIGILALPLAYWLGFELFGSISCAWIFVALMAISPYFVLYSQENREYSLWTAALLWLCASALQALRTMTRSAWAGYAASIAFALYTDPVSLAVVGGHATFFVLAERNRLARAPLLPIGAVAVGIGAFAPWLVVLARGRAQIDRDMAWIVTGRDPFLTTLRVFLGKWHLATIDFDSETRSFVGVGISFAALALSLAAFAILRRHASTKSWIFVCCVAVATVVPILGPDLVWGGHRSANPRYLVPLFMCIEIALAYAIWWGIVRNVRWQLAFASIVLVGSLSCASSARARTWWTKYDEQSIAIARTINRSSRPIVVSDNYVHLMLSLARYLKPETRIALAPHCYLCQLPAKRGDSQRLSARLKRTDDIFLLGPSQALQQSVRMRTSIRVLHVRCINVDRNCTSRLEFF